MHVTMLCGKCEVVAWCQGKMTQETIFSFEMQIVVGDNKVDTLKLRRAAETPSKHFNNNLHFDEFCVLVNLQRLAKAELPRELLHRDDHNNSDDLTNLLRCSGSGRDGAISLQRQKNSNVFQPTHRDCFELFVQKCSK